MYSDDVAALFPPLLSPTVFLTLSLFLQLTLAHMRSLFLLSLSLSLLPRLGSLSVSDMTAVAWALLFGDSRIFGDL